MVQPGPSSPAILKLRPPEGHIPAPEWTVKLEMALPTIPDSLKNKIVWIEDDGRSRIEEFQPQRSVKITMKKQVARKSTVAFGRRRARPLIQSESEDEGRVQPVEPRPPSPVAQRETTPSEEASSQDEGPAPRESDESDEEINSEPEYDPNYERYRCLRGDCESEFPDKFALKKHYVYVHENKEWRCGLCTNKYSTAARLLRHERKHLHRYFCPYCETSKRYGGWEKYAVRLHIRKHRGDRPYPCKGCGAAFKEKKDLKNHQPGCDPDVPLLTCPRCPLSFYNRLSWKRHVGHFHDLHYECEEPGCHEMFNNTSARTRHRQVHATGPQGGEQGDKTKQWPKDKQTGSKTEVRLKQRKKSQETRERQRAQYVELERKQQSSETDTEETPAAHKTSQSRRKQKQPRKTYRLGQEARDLEDIRDEDLQRLLGVLQQQPGQEKDRIPGEPLLVADKEVEILHEESGEGEPIKDEAGDSTNETQEILPDSSSEGSIAEHECTNEEDLPVFSPPETPS